MLQIGRAPLGIVCLFLCLVGCSSNFHEDYYIGVYEQEKTDQTSRLPQSDSNLKPSQFYRFKLDGWSSLFCDTRFESGWYDAQAVDRLFGEISSSPPNRQTNSNDAPGIGNAATVKIPTIATSGSVIKDKQIKVENITLIPRAGSRHITNGTAESIAPAFNTLEHAHVRITFTVADKKATVSQIELIGDGIATAAVNSEQTMLYCDILPGKSSRISIPSVDTVVVQHAPLEIESADAKLSGRTWSGTNVRAISASSIESFAFKGGTFQLLAGDVTGTPNQLHSKSAIGVFSKPETVEAETGFFLEMDDATIDKPAASQIWRAKFSVSGGSHLFVYLKDAKGSAITKPTVGSSGADLTITYGSGTNFADEIAKLDPAKLDPKEPQTKDLADAQISFSDNKNQMNVVRADSASDDLSSALAADPVQWSIPSATISAGAYTLTSATAGDDGAEPKRKIVEGQHTQFIFGPEGQAAPQKENQRFVIFMTSDPKVLTDRVRALVNSQQTQQALGQVIFGPAAAQQAKTTDSASRALSEARKRAANLVSELDSKEVTSLGGDDLAVILQQLATEKAGNP